ncbi:hypothetical protein HMPREF0765_0776 [Sphingobacterium spiritivorum ATCC 33300]|uniref:DUF4843 domain-containing protein n=1 Tax=Sphingobacterium spiritivorum ATCC 33300 TaxID=525372 RepID=C2FTZ4_SPHSI|nr:DUF4843 domain-containing protein [Sphingobacterium spiritivorum]EEI93624.1 hypothetical protein HMPREF0765_0776 [Sphingobacterium spiritivorum ATCC 33300]QQS95713.1 DUF4843 domain-containing protein [Sphingobacterium spiritivorum]
MKLIQISPAINLLVLLALVSSCKKTELITYNSERNLFFEVEDSRSRDHPYYDATLTVDSVRMFFSFLDDNVTSAELKIPLKMTGKQLEQPLPYVLVIDSANTTAVKGRDFEWTPQHIFPAGKSIDTLRIKVNRTTQMLNKTFRLTLELKENENFKTMIEPTTIQKHRSIRVKCYINDILFPPDGYLSTSEKQGADYYYGPFSRKKLNLLSMLLEEEYGEPFPPAEVYIYLVPEVEIIAQILNIYLEAQRENGTPVLEDDGTEMITGEYFK